MYVLATAGHVDHGKSALVRALTGMEPDRYPDERRRGMSLDLGFAWMTLPGGDRLALVDVPGHERFVSTMLAGAGPVEGVVLVVAADGGWSAQTQEHVDALDALGIAAGLVVITRTDLADPGPALEQTRDRLAATSLAALRSVTCSSFTGAGLVDVRHALDATVAGLAEPDRQAPTRLWIDRCFSIRGAGTVVTGTLNAGRIRTGEELILARTGRPVVVRGLECMNESRPAVAAVARVAVNLRGVSAKELGRGDVLLASGNNWALTTTIDVLLDRPMQGLSTELTMHIGSAAIPVRTRRLGARGVRLSVTSPVPVTYGDRVVLRDPGSRSILGAAVLDPLPRPLARRRGAASHRGDELAEMAAIGPDADLELRRRGIESAHDFARLGLGLPSVAPIDGWLIDPGTCADLSARLASLATEHRRLAPLDGGLSAGAIAAGLGLPDPELVAALALPPWRLVGGRLTSSERLDNALPATLEEAIRPVRERLRDNAFDAPTPSELRALGLTPAILAAAVRAGVLVSVGHGVFLGPDARAAAVSRLETLAQPFSTSQARTALGTSRRVALALLQWLDTSAVTVRLPDDRRLVRAGQVSPRG